MRLYRTIIAFDYPEAYDDEGVTKYINRTKYLPIDYLEDRTISSESHIVTQPLQNGDTMADHMYRMPTKLDLKGKFSLNGRNWNDKSYGLIFNSQDRLTSIEYIYEYIKNNGILCNITTVDTEIDSSDNISYDEEGNLVGNINPSKTRYITRDNMALTRISWTEKVNTLEFNFSFEEVMMVDTEIYQQDADELLPSTSYPQVQSLGSVLIDTGALPTTVIEILYKKGYIKDDWLAEVAANIGTTSAYAAQALVVVAIGIGVIKVTVAVTLALSKTAFAATVLGAKILSSVSAIVPVGTIVVAAIAIVAAIAYGIWKIFDYYKKKEIARKAFKLIDGKPDQDLNRYCNFMDAMEESVNKACSNMKVYKFESDEQQEVTIPIGNYYYFFTATKLDSAPYFNVDIRINGYGEQGDKISNRRASFPVVDSIFDFNENINLWFKDETKQYQVYLLNPNLNDIVNEDDGSKTVVAEKLSSYYIVICAGKVQDEINKIKEAIDNTLLEYEFD